jgi:hypothetical protein
LVDELTYLFAQYNPLGRSIHVRGKGCAHDMKTCP